MVVSCRGVDYPANGDHMSNTEIAIDHLRQFRENLERWEDGPRKTEDLPKVLRTFKATRDKHDELDEERKKVNAIIERLSRTHIPEQMRDENITTITLDDIGARFSISQRHSCSMPDKEGGMAWLRENGHGDLIAETVNASSLAAFAKSYAQEKGEELPEGKFKVSIMEVTSVTKVKTKG